MGTCVWSHGWPDVYVSPKSRRLADFGSKTHRAREKFVDSGPERFRIRTIRMRPKHNMEHDYWLLVLSHEIMHATGHALGSFRWGPHPFPQTTRFTLMTESSESEERVAEVGAELLTSRLGLNVSDEWRDNIGNPTDGEIEEATRRVEHVLSLVS